MPHEIYMDRPTHLVIRRGDDGEALDFFLRNRDHQAEDLTGRVPSDIDINFSLRDGTLFLSVSPDSIVSATDGHVRMSTWNAALIARVDTFLLEVQVVRAGSGIITFPETKKNPELEIIADAA